MTGGQEEKKTGTKQEVEKIGGGQEKEKTGETKRR